MSTVPPLSRRVLTALSPTTSTTGQDSEEPTTVACSFVRVEAALEAHLTALSILDRIEEAVVTAHGYPRVPLPSQNGAPDYAADAATIKRRLGPGPTTRQLTAELHHRQTTFASAAAAAGLGMARAQEARTARELSDAACHLLLAPLEVRADLALKLAVLIAAGEATGDDALTFPGSTCARCTPTYVSPDKLADFGKSRAVHGKTLYDHCIYHKMQPRY